MQEQAIVQEHSELQVVEPIHEQIVDITGLVNPHFSSFAVEAFAPQIVVLPPPFEEFTALVHNQVYQEQIVAGETTLNKVENPAVCVAHSAHDGYALSHTNLRLLWLDVILLSI